MPIKLLLDTDIGSDIDDAVALAYLLAQPECDLLGISTCTGDTQQRAALAAAICDTAGRPDIPIHAGPPGPFFTGPGQAHVPQYKALQNRKHRTGFPDDAVQYLRQTIRQHPGEITLLAIGPLTNIALLFKLDPGIPALLKQLVLMNGTFTGFPDDGHGHGGGPGRKEWNVRCDPFASAIVYDANCPGHVSVGLDVTHRCHMFSGEIRKRFNAGPAPLPLVAEFAEVWFEQRQSSTFHDPLAAALLFQPGLCKLTAGRVRIETVSPHLAGVSSFDPDAVQKPHRIAVDVDPGAFFAHFFSVFKQT